MLYMLQCFICLPDKTNEKKFQTNPIFVSISFNVQQYYRLNFKRGGNGKLL